MKAYATLESLLESDVEHLEVKKIGEHIAAIQHYRDGGYLFWYRKLSQTEFIISSVSGPAHSKVHDVFLKSRK